MSNYALQAHQLSLIGFNTPSQFGTLGDKAGNYVIRTWDTGFLKLIKTGVF
ncbi:hypothetical protein [Methyloglobulus sp.]|uniref:hypothetical protein n=1 Tax=Methyloglobulus sp. TaxID=2518622 RepID=UPI0032B73DB3